MTKWDRWTLYLVTDRQFAKETDSLSFLLKTVKSAIKGGVTVVQYREKKLPTRKMLEEAEELKKLCKSQGVLFLVNDRIDIALAVDADGVHLGQDDMPAHITRKLLGKSKVIGITVHNEEELKNAENEEIDYVSFAPVFATSTKPDHQTPLGIEKLKELASMTNLPVVAIGGINKDNAHQVFQTGVNGICVVSAIMGAQDPEKATRELLKRYKSG